MVAVATPVDPKRLARLAREPARVFGFSEVRTYRWPVLKVTVNGVDWYGPGHGPWLFAGDDCAVLTRAIERLGLLDPVLTLTHSEHVERHLGAEGGVVELPPAELVTLGDKHIVAVHDCGEGRLLPAVPVAYAERRWPGGEWQQLATVPVIRYHVDDNPVALIAAIQQ